jgi:chromosome transmission fidelity protein 1
MCLCVTFVEEAEDTSIAFMLLNPYAYFRQIVAQARSVLLAGGTMEPVCVTLTIFACVSSSSILVLLIHVAFHGFLLAEKVSEIVSLLFHDVPASQLSLFQCGHIVPPESIAGFFLSSGPCGIEFEFTYAQRGNMEMV